MRSDGTLKAPSSPKPFVTGSEMFVGLRVRSLNRCAPNSARRLICAGLVLVPMWFPQLKQVRASPKFKTFLIDLGLPDMWRKTGSWGDFCEPLGDDDFRCH